MRLVYEEPEELFGHAFSIDRKRHEPLSIASIAERLLKNSGATLGLTEEEIQNAILKIK